MLAMRDAYANELVNLGHLNPKIVVFDADVSKSTRSSIFQKAHPDRFFNLGVAEQNMLGVAAGFSLRGFIPFVNTFSFLLVLRAGDQLRNSIAFPKLNVKLVGHYGGLSDSYDGATHQAIEDLAIVRAIPNITIIIPADATETVKALPVIAKHQGPVYFRLCRNPVAPVYKDNYVFKIGITDILKQGKNVTIAATGIMTGIAMSAAEMLEKEGISAEVLNVSTLKPFDNKTLLKSVKKTGCIVTCEEHTINGGLFSAVAECLSIGNLRLPIKAVAINDKFGESGPYEELLSLYGLDDKNILRSAKEVIAQK